MKQKNFWILLLCMLSGLTIGNFLGELCTGFSFLNFINYGQAFGLAEPVTIDLGFILMTFKFQMSITLAGIFGLGCGILIFKKI